MNTKRIMSASAFLLAVIGLSLTFLPTEIAGYFLLSAAPAVLLTLQVLGALYFAFALLNWMARGSVIGGIYNRPVAIANFAHFLTGGLALVKGLSKHPELPLAAWMITGLYLIFALLFGMVFFRTPVRKQHLTAVN